MKFDLKYFIYRHNTLILFREAIKFTGKINDPLSRMEMRQFIRYEFDLNRNEENNKKQEYLIAGARKRINDFKETFFMAN